MEKLRTIPDITSCNGKVVDLSLVKKDRSPLIKKTIKNIAIAILAFIAISIIGGFLLVNKSFGEELKKNSSALDLVMTATLVQVKDLVSQRYHEQKVVVNCLNRTECEKQLPEIKDLLGLGTSILISGKQNEEGTFFTILLTNPLASHPQGIRLQIWKIDLCPNQRPSI
jgi:uncharacterized protein YneF (UPF0154 family)